MDRRGLLVREARLSLAQKLAILLGIEGRTKGERWVDFWPVKRSSKGRSRTLLT
jgi:hypothetical protein